MKRIEVFVFRARLFNYREINAELVRHLVHELIITPQKPAKKRKKKKREKINLWQFTVTNKIITHGLLR